MDKTVGILNTIFEPLKVKSRDPIVILWTSSGFGFHKTWIPDHFVPLVNEALEISVIEIDSVDDFPPLDSTINQSKVACPTIFDTTVKSDKNETSLHAVEDSIIEQEPNVYDNSNTDSNEMVPETDVVADATSNMVDMSSEVVETDTENLAKLNGKFLSTDRLLEVLVNENVSHTEIPSSVKEHVYFVLDHTANVNRKANAKKWSFGTTVEHGIPSLCLLQPHILSNKVTLWFLV